MTCCWWCCHETTSNLELPVKYFLNTNTFTTRGNFCSWSCMKSFAKNQYPTYVMGRVCENITLMRKKMYGVITPIKPAHDRYLLEMFGGTMTIEEFREGLLIDKGESTFIVNKSEFGTKEMPICTKIHDLNKINLINNTNANNEPLRLKRTKPLKRDSNLMSALGISVNNSNK